MRWWKWKEVWFSNGIHTIKIFHEMQFLMFKLKNFREACSGLQTSGVARVCIARGQSQFSRRTCRAVARVVSARGQSKFSRPTWRPRDGKDPKSELRASLPLKNFKFLCFGMMKLVILGRKSLLLPKLLVVDLFFLFFALQLFATLNLVILGRKSLILPKLLVVDLFFLFFALQLFATLNLVILGRKSLILPKLLVDDLFFALQLFGT